MHHSCLRMCMFVHMYVCIYEYISDVRSATSGQLYATPFRGSLKPLYKLRDKYMYTQAHLHYTYAHTCLHTRIHAYTHIHIIIHACTRTYKHTHRLNAHRQTNMHIYLSYLYRATQRHSGPNVFTDKEGGFHVLVELIQRYRKRSPRD